MSALVWLIPIALLLGGVGLCAFMWAARSGQFEDLDGAAERIFLDETDCPGDSTRSLQAKNPAAITLHESVRT